MSGKGSTFAYEVLRLNLNAVSRVGAWGSSGATDLFVRLHTSDPSTETAGTAEVAYTGYAAVVTTRSSAAGGWAISTPTSANATASPTSAITFGQMTAGSTGTITHFSLSTSSNSTSAPLWYSGTVTPNINYTVGVTPILTTTSSITED